MQSSNYIYLVITAVLLLMAFRIWRTGGRERRVRIQALWIGPLFITVMIGFLIYADPPPITPIAITTMIAAFALGLIVGWFRGKMTSITIDVETRELKSKASLWGILLLAGIFGLRVVARNFLSSHAEDWHIPPTVITDGFLLFAAAMILGRRLEIFVRCIGLLRETRAAEAAGAEHKKEVTEDHG